MKTTVLLRDDVYAALVNQFGKRGISKSVNEILFKEIVQHKKSELFGVDKNKKLTPFVRERRNRVL